MDTTVIVGIAALFVANGAFHLYQFRRRQARNQATRARWAATSKQLVQLGLTRSARGSSEGLVATRNGVEFEARPEWGHHEQELELRTLLELRVDGLTRKERTPIHEIPALDFVQRFMPEARAALRELKRLEAIIDDGTVRLPLQPNGNETDMEAYFDTVTRLCAALGGLRPDDPAWEVEQLVSAVAAELPLELRQRAATLLLGQSNVDARATSAADALLGDEDPLLRALASRHATHDDAEAHAIAIAADDAMPLAARVHAVAAVGRRFSLHPDAPDVTASALRSTSPLLVIAGAKAAGYVAEPPAMDALLAALREPIASIKLNLRSLISRRFAIRPDEVLAALSTSETSDAAVVEIAEALRRVAGVDAVAALRSAAESRKDRTLQRAVSSAITAITSRSPHASSGQLSVSEATAGQLSIDPQEPT